jgi:hypothetical protein
MKLRVRATGELVEATVGRHNVSVDDDDYYAWVLVVARAGGPPWPVKPGAAGCDYELAAASDEERERLVAGNYLDDDGSLVCFRPSSAG